MMEAERTTETSVDDYFTRQYIPEHKSELHIRRRENLKSHTDQEILHNVWQDVEYRFGVARGTRDVHS
jgi:hypothetical protein